ncbi:hypothetical protein CcaverHIS002_0504470 [Cutaneotrichosporon cavernicola]|uniref:Uncharacterized protein n=1 Tax=Cutaneotrichosporon cavernicola TaxID=279322 RepID=A0AA48L6J7_9TREE|nr:uncharacterized protein CcaverHIS019_0505010 [Cutaneotrichosporon cavernicola]BEI85046.1 hypothetical protein CcaverHIS002_0504470 [Cutaneotrichosporon cavernicola]BEI92873.1 hypothetical protein CcaverHIS019_0505010 [Cutaneotrichosporon cavernicola]BEJ00649.1 hypothetical protein CcaverHIS631_0505060 [Cutaneotrichosporon cavernicola]BEJ08414.1 hypothetical protein CcaverHIS641_0504990 [Cutaneotrichosporon cavernicola]
MRAALLLIPAVAVAAFTPIVIDIEFDTLAIPDFDHSAIATPVVAVTPFPAASSPALREEDELEIDWSGEGDTFDPVAYLDAQEAAGTSTSTPHAGLRGYAYGPARLAPEGVLSAAAGAVMDMF